MKLSDEVYSLLRMADQGVKWCLTLFLLQTRYCFEQEEPGEDGMRTISRGVKWCLTPFL
jgi:hypothetical protein